MKVGTKSVLFGAHCFFIHGWFVAYGWWKLYKFRRVYIGYITVPDTLEEHSGRRYPISYRRAKFASLLNYKVWIAFFIHDFGYWGKPNMDGKEGETHPEWACRFMNAHFGAPWGQFVLDHSRFYAQKGGRPVSPLCYADKLAIVHCPNWLYLRLLRASGELPEYMEIHKYRETSKGYTPDLSNEEAWLNRVKDYMAKWVEEHKDGRVDTWTARQGGVR